MVTTWFTSDLHLGHRKMIRLARRPFRSLEEMDNAIIDNWNAVVGKRDIVWVLGDFCLYQHPDVYLSRMHGRLHLVPGNHCDNKVQKNPRWLSVSPQVEIKLDGQKIVLNHYKMAVWNKHHRGALHFYGHSHGSFPGDSQCCDVGVDCWDFRPVSLDQIKERLAQSPPRQMVDHHGRLRVLYTPETVPFPGMFLEQETDERHISQADFAQSIEQSVTFVDEIMSGDRPIDAALAMQFERILAIPADIWLGMEERYRSALAADR